MPMKTMYFSLELISHHPPLSPFTNKDMHPTHPHTPCTLHPSSTRKYFYIETLHPTSFSISHQIHKLFLGIDASFEDFPRPGLCTNGYLVFNFGLESPLPPAPPILTCAPLPPLLPTLKFYFCINYLCSICRLITWAGLRQTGRRWNRSLRPNALRAWHMRKARVRLQETFSGPPVVCTSRQPDAALTTTGSS